MKIYLIAILGLLTILSVYPEIGVAQTVEGELNLLNRSIVLLKEDMDRRYKHIEDKMEELKESNAEIKSAIDGIQKRQKTIGGIDRDVFWIRRILLGFIAIVVSIFLFIFGIVFRLNEKKADSIYMDRANNRSVEEQNERATNLIDALTELLKSRQAAAADSGNVELRSDSGRKNADRIRTLAEILDEKRKRRLSGYVKEAQKLAKEADSTADASSKRKKLEDAISYLDRALLVDNRRHRLYFLKARYYLEIKNRELARINMERAVYLDEGNKDYKNFYDTKLKPKFRFW